MKTAFNSYKDEEGKSVKDETGMNRDFWTFKQRPLKNVLNLKSKFGFATMGIPYLQLTSYNSH